MVNSLRSILRKCQAVIVDMDGVVADTEPLKFAAYQEVFRDTYGVHLPADDVSWRGMKEEAVIDYWLHQFQLTGDHHDVIQAKRLAYRQLLRQGKVQPIPGVITFLQRARYESKLCGLATGSSRDDQSFVLSCLGLEKAFDAIVTLNDIHSPKPDPEIYFATAKLLGVRPIQCVVFEDSPSGVQAAKSAGMCCVGLTTSFAASALGIADFAVSDFTQLLELMDN